jgi:hypothetical protein
MTNSVVMIVPAAHRDEMNALAAAIDPDYGDTTFSVPLSTSGSAPATHYATHTWEMPGRTFHQLRLAVQAGQTPPGLEAHATALASLTIRAVENSLASLDNWLAALTVAGLQEIQT